MVQGDSHSFALEFRLRELDRELHKRFTDGVFCLQKILSNYKLIFPEFTDIPSCTLCRSSTSATS